MEDESKLQSELKLLEELEVVEDGRIRIFYNAIFNGQIYTRYDKEKIKGVFDGLEDHIEEFEGKKYIKRKIVRDSMPKVKRQQPDIFMQLVRTEEDIEIYRNAK